MSCCRQCEGLWTRSSSVIGSTVDAQPNERVESSPCAGTGPCRSNCPATGRRRLSRRLSVPAGDGYQALKRPWGYIARFDSPADFSETSQ